ncbi:aldose 1-epimerase family protein [Hymenobacter aerophilus]|uniref:aldose 1-epimerase family protein n=1 Tax=Hymenobacter aerophilus TaxID=119644 RepID=UPI00037397F2|nr:aldose 1-epimerase family protein [Hymenobacter aerophilus]
MVYTLENEHCRAQVSTRGAELTSLVRLDAAAGGLEYLWQADPAYWGRHAPVLFPIVGRLPENRYLHQGQTYELGQHGFARDQEFQLLHRSEFELTFALRDDAASRAVYPFGFALRISYRLAGTTLTVGWEVENPGSDELLFSIGAHPAFRCPLLPGETFEDYEFVFDHPVSLDRHLLQNGLFSGETTPLLRHETVLPLSYGLFAQDALVFQHFDFTSLTLRSRRSGHGVRARFDGFPYLGLWTAGPGAEFVCIEPWHGLAGSVGGPVELADKPGIMTLAAGQQFITSYSLTLA